MRSKFNMRPSGTSSLDHLVGPAEQRNRDFEAEGLRGLDVDHQLECCRLLDRNVSRPCPTENLANKGYYLAMHGNVIDAVGHKPSSFNIALEGEHGGQTLLDRERRNMRRALSEMTGG